MADIILYLNSDTIKSYDAVSCVVCKNYTIASVVKQECFNRDIAVLVHDDITAYSQLGLDGIYLSHDTTQSRIKELRHQYPNIQMGMDCQVSKHTAMVSAEAGADFVVFSGNSDTVLELTNWWGLMMQIPVVAYACDIVPEHADFVMLA